MKKLFTMLLAVLLSGCTSMRTVEAPPGEIRHMIAAGEAFETGDKLEIVTTDGRTSKLVVVEITDTDVVGQDQTIPIDQIVSVQKSEISAAKTTGLVVGGASTALLVLLLVALSSIAFMP